MAAGVRTVRGRTYHVFLSFRGVDTRKTFTDHLYTALTGSGLITFIDDKDIERGRFIDEEVQKAIKQSKSAILVLSKRYATSSSCLDELTVILEQRRSSGLEVLPVFYDVEPDHVWSQTGSFGEALAWHEASCAKENLEEKKREGMARIDMWRKGLKEIAELAGLQLKNRDHQHEARFIQEIVREIEAKVRRDVLRVPSTLIAIDSRCKDINSWLQDDSKDVGVMVICGMGGIGKTTIVKHVYNSNFRGFDGSSFLANIRNESEQPKGITRLQTKLLFDISKGKKEKIFQGGEGIIKIQNAVSCMRVLLVLDDVDQQNQLEAILGNDIQDWFYPGSKIIVTTRHMQLPKAYEACKIHKVKPLNCSESHTLFSIHACSQGHSSEGCMAYSESIVRKCEGLPLALEVLGSSLRGQSLDVWSSSLQKLDAIPNDEIQQKLKVSYDCLKDDQQKDLFLEIACFFVGTNKNDLVTILDECDFSTIAGVQNLMDRCLVTVDSDDNLMMPNLVRDMGREIVRQESPKQPGKRSRLWNYEDSFYVLDDKSGKGSVVGLFLDMHTLNDSKPGLRRRGNNLETGAFEKMKNLRLLKVNYLQPTGSYSEFPKRLKWLCWHGFHLPSIPDDFALESLVSLDMRYSSLKQLGNEDRFLGCLKILNLSHSKSLEKTPDFSTVPILERLILKNCTSLKVVNKSIRYLKRLNLLNLKYCEKLRTIPSGINMIESLETLVVSHCSSLDSFPVDLGRMASLKVLEADGLDMNRLLHNSKRRSWYALTRPRVQKHPEILLAVLPPSLVAISLVGCNLSDDAFPSDISHLSSLRELNLSNNPICCLPDCIRGHDGLQILRLRSCTRLRSVEGLPAVEYLEVFDCLLLEKITYQSSQGKRCTVSFTPSNAMVEIQFLFKLEPIEKVDVRMLTILGLANLESLASIEVMSYGEPFELKKRPVQGLYDGDIFSTFLPRKDIVEGWFSHSSGSSVTFTITPRPDYRIQGLNVICIYGLTKNEEYRKFYNFFRIEIRNITKGMDWTYWPSFFGVPEGRGDQDDIIWISHWNTVNRMACGDEVEVTIFGKSYFMVKECGVTMIYEHQDDHDRLYAESVTPVADTLTRGSLPNSLALPVLKDMFPKCTSIRLVGGRNSDHFDDELPPKKSRVRSSFLEEVSKFSITK